MRGEAALADASDTVWITRLLAVIADNSDMRAAATALLLLVTPFAAAAETVAVSPASCRLVVAHEAAPDVAYRPGADVRGRPVVPADLPGSPPIQAPESFTIPITVELDDRLGIPPAGDAAFTAEAQIGTVQVNADGTMTFNGQPLLDEEARRLRAACAEALAGR